MDTELTLYKIDTITGKYFTPDYSYFADNDNEFELIEEDTIDIDSIEELVTGYSESGSDTDIINYINDKIVPSIKQLNKKIKSIKEK